VARRKDERLIHIFLGTGEVDVMTKDGTTAVGLALLPLEGLSLQLRHVPDQSLRLSGDSIHPADHHLLTEEWIEVKAEEAMVVVVIAQDPIHLLKPLAHVHLDEPGRGVVLPDLAVRLPHAGQSTVVTESHHLRPQDLGLGLVH
jgi:hypothetical protein